MSAGDVRLQWVRDRALAALGLTHPAPFEELLSRGHGEEARAVLRFFDRGTTEGRDEEREAGAGLLLLRAGRRGGDEVTQKGKASLQSTNKESVSAVSSGSELEQRSTTESVEHTPQLQKDSKVRFFVALDEIPEEFVSDSTVYFLRDTNVHKLNDNSYSSIWNNPGSGLSQTSVSSSSPIGNSYYTKANRYFHTYLQELSTKVLLNLVTWLKLMKFFLK
ncbi:uncharacterized protein ACIB01_014906 [Guaruba guarouba]